MSVGKIWRYQFGPQKIDVRIIFFRLGRLKTLLLKNHIVREVGPFPMSCHTYIYIYIYIYENLDLDDYGRSHFARPINVRYKLLGAYNEE